MRETSYQQTPLGEGYGEGFRQAEELAILQAGLGHKAVASNVQEVDSSAGLLEKAAELGFPLDPSLTSRGQLNELVILYLLSIPDQTVTGKNSSAIIREATGITKHHRWNNTRNQLGALGIVNTVKSEHNPKLFGQISLNIDSLIDSIGNAFVTERVIDNLKGRISDDFTADQLKRLEAKDEEKQRAEIKLRRSKQQVTNENSKESVAKSPEATKEIPEETERIRERDLVFNFKKFNIGYKETFTKGDFANLKLNVRVLMAIGQASTFEHKNNKDYRAYVRRIVNKGIETEDELISQRRIRDETKRLYKAGCLGINGTDIVLTEYGMRFVKYYSRHANSRPAKAPEPPTNVNELIAGSEEPESTQEVPSGKDEAEMLKEIPIDPSLSSEEIIEELDIGSIIEQFMAEMLKEIPVGTRLNIMEHIIEELDIVSTIEEFMKELEANPDSIPDFSMIPKVSEWFYCDEEEANLLSILTNAIDVSEEVVRRRMWEMRNEKLVEVQSVQREGMFAIRIFRKGLANLAFTRLNLREKEAVINETMVDEAEKIIDDCLHLAESLNYPATVKVLEQKRDEESLFELTQARFGYGFIALHELHNKLSQEYEVREAEELVEGCLNLAEELNDYGTVKVLEEKRQKLSLVELPPEEFDTERAVLHGLFKKLRQDYVDNAKKLAA